MGYLFYEACKDEEIPEGGKLRVAVEGYHVCLYRVDGTLYASGDACPHERVSLGDGGRLDGEVITCGAHRWGFNVRTGECYANPQAKLTTHPVGRKGDLVYVGFWSDEVD